MSEENETGTGNTLHDWLGGEEGLKAHRDAVDSAIITLIETTPHNDAPELP